MAKRRTGGRKKKSRNKGYFYRKDRGWYATDGRKMIPLEYEDGTRIRDESADELDVREAYARWLLAKNEEAAKVAVIEEADSKTTLAEICVVYLENTKANDSKSTYEGRADTLFDFCYGLPPKLRPKQGQAPKKLSKKEKEQIEEKRIHKGYGGMRAVELKPLHIDQWLNAHPTWNGSRRSRIQAVKRAMNYGVEAGIISKNPLKGYRTPRSRGRVTYITPEQEAEMYKHASKAFTMALRVCIRTGARFGCEFAKVTAAHVKDHGDRMEWVFPPSESKTRRLREILIRDTEILELVREHIRRYPKGPIFRNTKGTPWERGTLSRNFQRLRHKLKKLGVEFDHDACMYSCRHTYAKRTLQGYWTGKATNIETLARLMGNSPQTCREHYLQWCESYKDPLWDAA